MDQIAKDILELVENHQKPVSVHQIMMEYHRNTDKHLYMQVDYFGYKSVAQFLAVLEQLELEMSPQNMLEVKVRGRHMPKSSSDDIAVRIVSSIYLTWVIFFKQFFNCRKLRRSRNV